MLKRKVVGEVGDISIWNKGGKEIKVITVSEISRGSGRS
jgi:hypothetical protein